MTVRVFADTNLFIYAESQDQDKAACALTIIQNNPVISSQVINETVSVLSQKTWFFVVRSA